MQDPKKATKHHEDRESDLDISVHDFASSYHTHKTPRKHAKKKPAKAKHPRHTKAHGLGAIPPSVIWSVVVVAMSTAFLLVISHQKQVSPTQLLQNLVKPAEVTSEENTPTEIKVPGPAAAAPKVDQTEQLGELPPEEQLALVNPAWRKRWEHYKRMFMMAQQMHQQPPMRPKMPSQEPPREVATPHEDVEDGNPFGIGD